ncbi:MAG: hypothetical protein WCP95_04400 [Actinomycetes bacterium]
MALAVITVAVLYLLIPADFRAFAAAVVVYPVALLVLLAILTLGDPGRIDQDKPWLRFVTGVLIGAIALATGVSAIRLVVGILQKASFTSPGELLTIGAIVWLTNVIAFALLFWHLDRGGPAVRAKGTSPVPPGFRFQEEDLPGVASADWFPQFVDYFALSFNTSTAFGPADVSAIRHWSKLLLVLESAISLTLVALVVARAINIL